MRDPVPEAHARPRTRKGPDIFLEYYGRTDVGRKREHNEDTFYFSKAESFCVVADGMGGRKSGEVASKLCVDILRKHFHYHAPKYRPTDSPEEVKRSITMLTTLLSDWIQKINHEIYQLGCQEAKQGNMGTTLVLLHLYASHGILAHVGDSRIYRIRDDEGIRQVTEDHSLINQEIKRKKITAEEAKLHTRKNIVTRALGTRPQVEPDIQVLEVEEGDVFLLCSDGLSDLVSDDEMANIVLNNIEDLDFALGTLIDLANARGGKDNITVLVAQAFDLPDR